MPFTPSTEDESWHVCHTRPRCEKKIADVARRGGIEHYLPLVTRRYRYGNRERTFSKPLFPGYVFLRVPFEKKSLLYQGDYAVRFIRVEKEQTFLHQLEQIRALIDAGLQVRLFPALAKGVCVKVVAGPLRGMEAVVDDPKRPRGIVVTMDILGQSVHANLPSEWLEILPE